MGAMTTFATGFAPISILAGAGARVILAIIARILVAGAFLRCRRRGQRAEQAGASSRFAGDP